jgi:hypothetical protein
MIDFHKKIPSQLRWNFLSDLKRSSIIAVLRAKRFQAVQNILTLGFSEKKGYQQKLQGNGDK